MLPGLLGSPGSKHDQPQHAQHLLDQRRGTSLQKPAVLPACSAQHSILVTQAGMTVQALEVVVAAQEAAGLLVPQGDYTGALDVLDELQVSAVEAAHVILRTGQ